MFTNNQFACNCKQVENINAKIITYCEYKYVYQKHNEKNIPIIIV